MNSSRRLATTGWRRWLPFVAIALVYAFVATHQIDLPGIFADAINPDYLVARILNPHPEPTIVWILLAIHCSAIVRRY